MTWDHEPALDELDQDEPLCADCGQHIDEILVDGVPTYVHCILEDEDEP